MRLWARNTPVRKIIRDISVCVFVALITVAAVTGLINSYRYDSDSRARSRATQDSLLVGCERGNEFRSQAGDIARSVKGIDDYIVVILKESIAHPPPGTTQAEIEQSQDFVRNFERLASDVKIPPLQDCNALYGKSRQGG